MKKWLQLSDGKFKKPILRVGTFQKESDGTQFTITQEHIEYLAGAFSRRVPTPLEHTTEPDANRGWVTGMEVEGEYLNGIFEFSELVQDPNIFDTSVYIPIEAGRMQPIEHVALTSYPVVDGLGKFEAIACSLVDRKEKENELMGVNWASLRTTLELSEDLTEENVVETLTKRFSDLSEKVSTLELSNKQLLEEKAALQLSDPPKITIEQIKQKHGKMFKFAHDARQGKINNLPLSKCVRDELVKVFCSDEGLALALSDSVEDNFEKVVAALEQNEVIETGERSGIQLSDSKRGQSSGLVEDARRRAEAAKKGDSRV